MRKTVKKAAKKSPISLSENKNVAGSAGGRIAVVSEKSLTKNQIIQELVRSPHGDLAQYVPVGLRAAMDEPEFMAHLIAWNGVKGEIRDAKVALPVVQLASGLLIEEFVENAMAHLAALDPRNFVRALRFGKQIKTPNHGHALRRLVERYLRTREANWAKWERTAIQHRSTLKELYTLYHVKPGARADEVLFKNFYPVDSTFAVIPQLKNMSASEAAGQIITRKIPFLIAAGALGAKMKEPDLLMALIGRMSATELVTNMKRLEKLGVKNIPACRAALEEALTKAASSKKNMLKTSVAADAVEDEGLREKLNALQERQIENKVRTQGIEGDWLVCGDKSGSMRAAIETARHVAATLAKMVKGQVHLVFFDDGPRYVEATGRTYEDLLKITQHVGAGGGTNAGCALQYAIDNKMIVGGIAMVSDGGENRSPCFADRYNAYKLKFDCEPTVYFYRFSGDQDCFSDNMKAHKLGFETFDLRGGLDYYSLPNLVATMRTNRYSLVDEIMAMPLLTLDRVMGVEKESVA